MACSLNPLAANICSAFRSFQNGEYEPEEDSVNIPATMCYGDRKLVKSLRPLLNAIHAYGQEVDTFNTEKILKTSRAWNKKESANFYLNPYYWSLPYNLFTVQNPNYLKNRGLHTFCCNRRFDDSCALVDRKILGNHVVQDLTNIISFLERHVKPETKDLPRDFINLVCEFDRSLLNFYSENPEYPT